VTWDYAGHKGGLGRLLQWLRDSLTELGAEVQVASPHSTRPVLPITKSIGEHWLFSLLLPFVLQRWIDTNHIQELIIPGGPGGVILFRKPKRCTLTVLIDHTYAQQSRVVPGQRWKRIFLPLEKRTYTMADKLLAVSDDTKAAVKKYYHLEAETIIPIGCDPIMPVEKENLLCVCVGRLMKRKGTDALLKSWEIIQKAVPNATLIVVGDGPLRSLVQQHKNIEWHASLPHEDVLAVLGRAQLALCPFYLEGFSLVCSESLRTGTPVVGFDADGIRCMVDPEISGILTPLGDVHSFARAAIHLLQEPAECKDMSTKAQRQMQARYNSDKAKQTLRTIFRFS